MGNRQILAGRIIGHLVKFLPRQENECASGVTIIKQPKVGAFVTVQVDDKKTYTVPCRPIEKLLRDDQEPTEEMKLEVYNDLVKQHPFNSPREFTEHVTSRAKGAAGRRYELNEPQ